jgi:N-acetylglucosaminyl-diphospho-decaprenol L-rhamnosyltransferase
VAPPLTRVGIVVLTHNRFDELSRTLERLLALPERPPIIVVDNASDDGTPVRLRSRFPEVAVAALSVNSGAAGRNAGVALLDTPYVAFCDDDTWWAPGALARAAALLDAHPTLALITGKVLVGPEQHEDPTCAVMAASPLRQAPGLPGRPVLGFLAGASVVRHAAFLAAGGFEPRLFLGAEERLLAIDLAAAGWALAYVEDVVAHHHPSPHRDPRARRRLLLRNELWCAWLRRPAASALRETGRALVAVAREPGLARGLIDALGGARWALGRRRVVPVGVELALRRLEDRR